METATEERASDRKTASTVMAMAGRAARACDVCAHDRARWYCAADEAYLCGRCDNSVHCVNALASRHERVRLRPNGAPCKDGDRSLHSSKSFSGLHVKKTMKGGKIRSQTKIRSMKDEMLAQSFFSNAEDTRVPGYPESLPEDQGAQHGLPAQHVPEMPCSAAADEQGMESCPSDGYVSLEVPQEFDALERGCVGVTGASDDDEYLDFTDIVTEADFLDDIDNGDDGSAAFNQDNVKSIYSPDSVKSESFGEFQPALSSSEGGGAESTNIKDEKNVTLLYPFQSDEGKRNLPPLKLNYDDILTAWSDRGPLWTADDGQPQTVPVFPGMDFSLNLDLESFQREQVGEVPVLGMGDEALEVGGGREARVMRYREKRRTRLFSKQIRYEVRKLNAERRPRMKGRFVKRLPP